MYIYVCAGVCIHMLHIQTEYMHESRLLGLGSTMYAIKKYAAVIYLRMHLCMWLCLENMQHAGMN